MLLRGFFAAFFSCCHVSYTRHDARRRQYAYAFSVGAMLPLRMPSPLRLLLMPLLPLRLICLLAAAAMRVAHCLLPIALTPRCHAIRILPCRDMPRVFATSAISYTLFSPAC